MKRDEKEACRLFKLAADQGCAPAQIKLGFMYGTGQGVEKDEKEACRLYKLAADQGHEQAQFNLGVMYGTGQGVEKDGEEACRLYKLAADQGHEQAQFNLGLMYDKGRGVDQNPLEALHWFLKSKHPKGKVYTQTFLPKNPYTPLIGDLFPIGVSVLLEKYRNLINIQPALIPQEWEQMSKPIVALAQGFNPFLESLKIVKPGFMVTGVELSYLVKPLLSAQITPFFSLDEVDGVSYLTMGEDNVGTVKRLIPFLKQFEDAKSRWGSSGSLNRVWMQF